MLRILWSLLILMQAGHVSALSIDCFQISPFDGNCQFQPTGDVVFVTTQPCEPSRPAVAIVLVEDDIVKRSDLEEKKNYTFHLKDSTIVTSVEIFDNGLNDIHKIKLDMTNKNFKKKFIFELTINSDDCYKTPNTESFVEPVAEIGQQRIGEFSTLFIPPQSTDNTSLSIPPHKYVIYFNPCTVPFSYLIKIFTKDKLAALHQFTDTMNDTLLPVPGDSKGGLQLFTENIFGPEYHKVRVIYTEKTGVKSRRLFNQLWNSHLGLMCPIHPCKSQATDQLYQECSTPWVDYGNKIRNARLNITFHPCTNPYTADMVIDIEDDKELLFKELKSLTAIREDKWVDDKYTVPLQLGYIGYEREDSPWDGFLPLDEGRISLYVVERRTGRKGHHVLIFRHYPTSNTAFPIFNTFYDNIKCKKKVNNKRAILIGLVCALVVFLALLFFVCYVRRRVRQKRLNGNHKQLGLPHQIQLEDGEFCYQDDL